MSIITQCGTEYIQKIAWCELLSGHLDVSNCSFANFSRLLFQVINAEVQIENYHFRNDVTSEKLPRVYTYMVGELSGILIDNIKV